MLVQKRSKYYNPFYQLDLDIIQKAGYSTTPLKQFSVANKEKKDLLKGQIKKSFEFLTARFNFKIEGIETDNYGIYAKFVSNSVGIYFTFDFREFVPRIQLTKLNGDVLKTRPGYYALIDLYKDDNFVLNSFYLDEILIFKKCEGYTVYFKDVKTTEDTFNKSSELLEKYAMEYVKGDELSYTEIDKWYRKYINE